MSGYEVIEDEVETVSNEDGERMREYAKALVAEVGKHTDNPSELLTNALHKVLLASINHNAGMSRSDIMLATAAYMEVVDYVIKNQTKTTTAGHA